MCGGVLLGRKGEVGGRSLWLWLEVLLLGRSSFGDRAQGPADDLGSVHGLVAGWVEVVGTDQTGSGRRGFGFGLGVCRVCSSCTTAGESLCALVKHGGRAGGASEISTEKVGI